MLTQSLQKLFTRDLTKLQAEIESYNSETTLWKVDKNILNSAGNLALHLSGNLQHFIGAILGGSGYQRQRDLEFSLKDVPKKELISQIEATNMIVSETIGKLSEEQLEADYPLEVFGYKMTTEFFLVHLAMHLDYHLGQVNYHRRLLDVE